MVNLAADLARAFRANYSEFPNGCLGLDLALGVQRLQVFVHRRHSHLKQLSHHRLGQPQRVVDEPALDAGSSIFGLVEQEFSGHHFSLSTPLRQVPVKLTNFS